MSDYCHFDTRLTGGYDIVELLETLEDCRNYIAPTIGVHEEISTILGWCDCGYCKHVPKERPGQRAVKEE